MRRDEREGETLLELDEIRGQLERRATSLVADLDQNPEALSSNWHEGLQQYLGPFENLWHERGSRIRQAEARAAIVAYAAYDRSVRITEAVQKRQIEPTRSPSTAVPL
jgi:hypothetical protein